MGDILLHQQLHCFYGLHNDGEKNYYYFIGGYSSFIFRSTGGLAHIPKDAA
jgi:hypothetical protein